MQQSRQFQSAIEYFDQAIKTDPNCWQAWEAKGRLFFDLGRKQDALALFDKQLEKDKNKYAAWNNKGIVFRSLGRLEDALHCFTRAIGFNPKCSSAWNNKGKALSEFKRNEEALECHNQSLIIDPKNPSFLCNKGIVLYDLGRVQEAVECYERTIEINPLDFYPWYMKGLMLKGMKRHEEALMCFEESLRVGEGNARIEWIFAAMNGKFDALWELGRWMDLIVFYERALEKREGEEHELLYATIFVKNKREEALKRLREETNERMKEALEMLSMVRKVFFVMKRIDIPPEMRWKIVMEGKEEKLSWEEKKNVVKFGSDERKLEKRKDEFWEHVGILKAKRFLDIRQSDERTSS